MHECTVCRCVRARVCVCHHDHVCVCVCVMGSVAGISRWDTADHMHSHSGIMSKLQSLGQSRNKLEINSLKLLFTVHIFFPFVLVVYP